MLDCLDLGFDALRSTGRLGEARQPPGVHAWGLGVVVVRHGRDPTCVRKMRCTWNHRGGVHCSSSDVAATFISC